MRAKSGINYFLTLLLSVEVGHWLHAQGRESTEFIETRQLLTSEQLCEDNLPFEDLEEAMDQYAHYFNKNTGQNLQHLVYTPGRVIVPYRARDSPLKV